MGTIRESVRVSNNFLQARQTATVSCFVFLYLFWQLSSISRQAKSDAFTWIDYIQILFKINLSLFEYIPLLFKPKPAVITYFQLCSNSVQINPLVCQVFSNSVQANTGGFIRFSNIFRFCSNQAPGYSNIFTFHASQPRRFYNASTCFQVLFKPNPSVFKCFQTPSKSTLAL